MPINGLEFQTVDVKFTQGLDTKTEKKLVANGKWNILENCTLTEDRTPRRRDGITSLVTAANGNGVTSLNNEILTINGQTLSSVTTGQLDAVVAKSGQLGYVQVEKSEVYNSTSTTDSMDSATGNGFTCHVWRDAATPTTASVVKYTLVDETTGAKVFDGVTLSATLEVMSPRVAFSTDAFFITWINWAAGPVLTMECVVVRVVSGSAPTQGTRVALITSGSLGLKNFDMVSADLFAAGAPRVAIAYTWNDGVTSVRYLLATHAAGVPSIAQGPVNVVPEGAGAGQQTYASIAGLAVALFNSTAAGVFSMSTGIPVLGTTVSSAGAVTFGPNTLDAATTVTAGSSHITAMVDASANIHLYYDNRAALGVVGFYAVTTSTWDPTMGAVSVAAVFRRSSSFDVNAARASGPQGPWIAGKAFRVGTSFYLPMYIIENHQNVGVNSRTTNSQSSFFLVDGATGVVVAKALYGTFANDGIIAPTNLPTATSTPGSVATLSSGVFSIDVAEVVRITNTGTDLPPELIRLRLAAGLTDYTGFVTSQQTGVSRIKLTPNTTLSPSNAVLGESIYFSGGQITAYEGSGLVEHGFPMFPEGISVVATGGGTGAMTAGVHRVTAVYEWYDGAGNRHQSAPALDISVTTVATGGVTIIVPTLQMSQKASIRIVPYITQAGLGIFYRAGATASNINITTASTLTLVTTPAGGPSDDALGQNESLYFQPSVDGSVLPNLTPPPSNHFGVHQNRIFFDYADEPGKFGYSQQLVPNTGLEFHTYGNRRLGGSIDAAYGKITGFAAMDEKAIIFCEKKPFVVYGAGPNAGGGFNGYGEPQEVSSDVGCNYPNSILKMPDGIIFKSTKGWYLLGRDLVVRYIGEGVEDFDANGVSSAVLMADRQECRFSSTSGTQLIYSYESKQWSTTVYISSTGAGVANYTIAGATWSTALNRYVSISTTLGLNQDTPGVYLDQPAAGTAAAIDVTARTSWLRMASISGAQRVRMLYLTGTVDSGLSPTSTYQITCAFNDAYGLVDPGSYVFTGTWSTIFPSYVAGTSVDLRHHMRTQKCKSVAFTFIDRPTVANPAGVNFQALSLELGMKRGIKKLPAVQST